MGVLKAKLEAAEAAAEEKGKVSSGLVCLVLCVLLFFFDGRRPIPTAS